MKSLSLCCKTSLHLVQDYGMLGFWLYQNKILAFPWFSSSTNYTSPLSYHDPIAQKCYTSFSHISSWHETTGLVITPSSFFFFFVFEYHNGLCLIFFLLWYQIFDLKYKLFSFVSNSLAIFITAANCSFDSLSLCLLLLFQAFMIISFGLYFQ